MSLVLSDLQRRFGSVAAVDGVSLTAGAGEIVCLFGPSGCGKTTLLRLAAGFERPDAGVVEIGGARLSGPGLFVPPERRPIGVVFQDYVLFPHMTAAENVAFGLTDLPRAARPSRACAELAAAGLPDHADRYPHQLSGGQQQRVALARALARRPRVMLLDEPFASIDPVLRRRLREDVRAILTAADAATILVTHDPEEALAVADRIAVMRAGRILEIGTPEDLYRRPQTQDGASLFPGAQPFAVRIAGGRLEAPFGAAPAPGEADGPAVAVFLAGALTCRPDPAGSARVLETRFQGPGHVASLQAGAVRFKAASTIAIAAGTHCTIDIDPAYVRLFRSRGPDAGDRLL